jgi:hypothetical protein
MKLLQWGQEFKQEMIDYDIDIAKSNEDGTKTVAVI